MTDIACHAQYESRKKTQDHQWERVKETIKRGKVQSVIDVRQIFNPMVFIMKNGVLGYTDPIKPFNALRICLP